MKKDRFLIGILVGIGILAVLAIVLFSTRQTKATYVADDNPAGVVQNYVLALYKMDYPRAYGYLAEGQGKPDLASFRQSFTVQRFDIWLAAALYFKDSAPSRQTCLVLENHPIFGGQARRNEFIVDGQRLMAPQGSNWFWVPTKTKLVGDFYTRIGVDPGQFKYQEWGGPPPAMPLSRTSYHFARNLPPPPNFGFYFGERFGKLPGEWVVDPWRNIDRLPLSPAMRADFAKYLKIVIDYHQSPPHDSEELLRRYDTMTAEEVLMERDGLSLEFIRMFVTPHLAAAIGAGPDAVTGCRYRVYGSGNNLARHSFPGGNTGFTRHIVKSLIPDSIPGPLTLEAICRNRINFAALDRPANQVRIRLRLMAVRVEHEGEPGKAPYVRIVYTRDGKAYRLKARAVVMAGGGWITKHVVRDLPATHREAYDQFLYNATIVVECGIAQLAIPSQTRPFRRTLVRGFRLLDGGADHRHLRRRSRNHRARLTHRSFRDHAVFLPWLARRRTVQQGAHGDSLDFISRFRAQGARAVYGDVRGLGI